MFEGSVRNRIGETFFRLFRVQNVKRCACEISKKIGRRGIDEDVLKSRTLTSTKPAKNVTLVIETLQAHFIPSDSDAFFLNSTHGPQQELVKLQESPYKIGFAVFWSLEFWKPEVQMDTNVI